MDKKQSSSSQEETTLEVRIKDVIQIEPVKNESKQFISYHIERIKTKPTKSSSDAAMERQGRQIHLTQQDSCIVISREGFKPLTIKLKFIKSGPNYPIMHYLNIQLAASASENVSKIAQKQEFHLSPERTHSISKEQLKKIKEFKK